MLHNQNQGKMTFELCIGIEQNIARIDFNKGILLQKFHIAFLSFSLAHHCGIKGGGTDFILLPRLVPDPQSPQSQILAVFGPFGTIFGQFWALEIPKLTNKAGTPWNEVQDT